MKIKTSELTDAALDWAVNQIEECCDDPHTPLFSTSWAQAGPIIESEGICLYFNQEDADWEAYIVCEDKKFGGVERFECTGPTPLIAAMRCYVAFELGDECDIPDELMKEDKPDWRDPNSGCYCVVCLAPVREDIFVQRGGCCPNHKFDDECTYR